MAEPAYDFVVFGATSFVGKILCRYLVGEYGAGGMPKWAAAARSRSKLEALRGDLGAPTLPLIVADAADETSLRAMCGQARAICSTVGPYALYGEPLVKVCAETGTDYCDLTGEAYWIKRMLDRYEAAAKASGARIVNCCGFDSIPSDLGVYFLEREARQRFGHPLSRVKMRVRAMRGGFSGGTVASMMAFAEAVAHDPALRRQVANPYVLVPSDMAPKVRQPSLSAAGYDSDFGAWTAPFVMAGINTRVVHRTNALTGFAYGRDFVYGEAVMTGRGRVRSLLATGGLGAFLAGSALAPTRWLMKRFLPAPGEGPSPEAQKAGFFDLRFFGADEHGHALRAKVAGDADPGYGSTGKMLGQAVTCLAMDTPKEEKPGGFWTPAALLGDRLIARLKAHAGLSFELLDN